MWGVNGQVRQKSGAGVGIGRAGVPRMDWPLQASEMDKGRWECEGMSFKAWVRVGNGCVCYSEMFNIYMHIEPAF